MRKYTQEELQRVVLDIIDEPLAKSSFERDTIDVNQDLLKTGCLDSVAFVYTIMEPNSPLTCA